MWRRRQRTIGVSRASACVALAAAVCCSGPPESSSSASADARVTSASSAGGPVLLEAPSRTIRIPVRPFASVSPDARGTITSPALTIRPEAPDQQAEGPQSFAVLANGELVVADPLVQRLAVYSGNGEYLRSIPTGGPVSDVAPEGDHLIITFATAEEQRRISLTGEPVSRTSITAASPEPTVTLNSDRSGVIRWSEGQFAASATRGALEVRLDDPEDRLASLRVIPNTAREGVYVAAEAADRSGKDLSTLTTIVRRYSRDAELQLEIRDIPLDYYVAPVTPLRVAHGRLYQLYTQREGVMIHVWDLR